MHDNNEPTTGNAGSQVAELPSGGGILLLGVDHVDVERNRIENNDFFGIGMIDYCLAVDGTDFDCSKNPPDVRDTSPEYNRFVSNILIDNGTNPPPGPFEASAADILAIGGRNNCASQNTFATSTMLPPLPECSPS